MRKRDDGFLRYEIKIVKPDGSERVIENEATARRCNIIGNRFNRAEGRCVSNGETLRFRVSKVL